MREQLTKLQQLQEKEITLREGRILHRDGHEDLAALEQQIEQLRAGIDPVVLSRFDRLFGQQGQGVVTVDNGLCLSCNLVIPQGDLNRIGKGVLEPVCPNCGVFLVL